MLRTPVSARALYVFIYKNNDVLFKNIDFRSSDMLAGNCGCRNNSIASVPQPRTKLDPS